MAEILVVDDDPLAAAACRRVLEASHHRVSMCGNGGSALETFSRRAFDAAVLDVRMEGMDGLSVCRALRQRGDATPIIVFTAQSGTAEEVEALQAGADSFLAKPYEPALLSARVDAVLRRPGMARGLRLGRATFDGQQRTLTIDAGGPEGRRSVLTLSSLEARALTVLAARIGQITRREELLATCWDGGQDNDNALAAVAARLRPTLAKAGLSLRAFRGRGLRLDVADTKENLG